MNYSAVSFFKTSFFSRLFSWLNPNIKESRYTTSAPPPVGNYNDYSIRKVRFQPPPLKRLDTKSTQTDINLVSKENHEIMTEPVNFPLDIFNENKQDEQLSNHQETRKNFPYIPPKAQQRFKYGFQKTNTIQKLQPRAGIHFSATNSVPKIEFKMPQPIKINQTVVESEKAPQFEPIETKLIKPLSPQPEPEIAPQSSSTSTSSSSSTPPPPPPPITQYQSLSPPPPPLPQKINLDDLYDNFAHIDYGELDDDGDDEITPKATEVLEPLEEGEEEEDEEESGEDDESKQEESESQTDKERSNSDTEESESS